ncbi:MAG: daunorubicin C-13 ketoreductase [Myxococcaceae bacterium]
MADSTKTAVVTGGTSGLGEAAVMALAQAGWRVLVVGRDAQRGAEVTGKAGPRAEFLKADLFSLEDVRRLAADIQQRAPRLDLLINNAGGVFSKGPLTADGLERTFELNVAAPYVLTEALLDNLAAAKGRVINVATGIAKGFKAPLDEVVGPKARGGIMAYVKNKMALIALTREQQRRHGDRGVTFVALHPGIITTTRFGQTMTGFNPFTTIGPFFSKLFHIGVSLETAQQRYLKVGTEPVEPAGYYYEGTLREAPKGARDEQFSQGLWAKLQEVTAPQAQA